MDLSPQLLDGVAAHLPPATVVALADTSPWAAAVLATRLRAIANTYRPDTQPGAPLLAFWEGYWRIPRCVAVGGNRAENWGRRAPLQGAGGDRFGLQGAPDGTHARVNGGLVHGTPLTLAAEAGDLEGCRRLCGGGNTLYPREAAMALIGALGKGHLTECQWLADNHVDVSVLMLDPCLETAASQGDAPVVRWLLWCGCGILDETKREALHVALDLGLVGVAACLLEHAHVVEVDGQAAIQFGRCVPRSVAAMLWRAASACSRDVCELVMAWARPARVQLRANFSVAAHTGSRRNLNWLLAQPGITLTQNVLNAYRHSSIVAQAVERRGTWLCSDVVRHLGTTRDHIVADPHLIPLRRAVELNFPDTVKWLVQHFDLTVSDDMLVAAALHPNIPLCEWLAPRLRGSESGVGVRVLVAMACKSAVVGCVWAVRWWGLTREDVRAACKVLDARVLENWLVGVLERHGRAMA